MSFLFVISRFLLCHGLTSFWIPEVNTGDRIPTQHNKRRTAGVLRMQPNSHLTQNDEALRHLCDTSLTGTEGHLHSVNKGNPALHHHNYCHKETTHPTIQEAWNVSRLRVTLRRLFSFIVNQACIWLTTTKSMLTDISRVLQIKRLLGVYFSILLVEAICSPTA